MRWLHFVISYAAICTVKPVSMGSEDDYIWDLITLLILNLA